MPVPVCSPSPPSPRSPLLAACGGSDDEAAAPAETPATAPATPPASGASEADLAGVKDYLLEHTALLTGFTGEFAAAAQEYHDLAEAAGFDYEALWQDSAAEVGPLVDRMKELWIEGNPYYERVEGVVAGTPSLAEYDVILDAGSSAAEDPESAVPVRPDAAGRNGARAAGQPLQPDRGNAVGHAARGSRQAVHARRPRR